MTAAIANDLGVFCVSLVATLACVPAFVSSAYSISTINKVYNCFCANITNGDCQYALDQISEGISISDRNAFCGGLGVTKGLSTDAIVLAFSMLALLGGAYVTISSTARVSKGWCYKNGGYQQI